MTCCTRYAYSSRTARAVFLLISMLVICASTTCTTSCCTLSVCNSRRNPYAYNSRTARAEILLISMLVICGSTSRAMVGITGSSSSTMLASGPEPLRDPLVKKFTAHMTHTRRHITGSQVSGKCSSELWQCQRFAQPWMGAGIGQEVN